MKAENREQSEKMDKQTEQMDELLQQIEQQSPDSQKRMS